MAMEVNGVYYIGNEGLKIYPTPSDAYQIEYKFYVKRR